MNPIQQALDAINSLPRGASFNRGKSKQDYATPQDFIFAVENKFGKLEHDLAASESNTKAPTWFCEAADALSQPWGGMAKRGGGYGLCWLNPPFDNIAPWAKKCAEESKLGARILFLVPASVGSNWFREHVHNRAFVNFLNPRLCFDGKNPYPKDTLLAEYGTPRVGYDVWKWK